MRRKVVEVVMEEAPKRKRAARATRAPKVPKVDEAKLERVYLPPADPEKPKFVDLRIEYYRRMAKAIWIKCLDCSCGRASMTDAGYAVPKCMRSACSLYEFRGEVFLESIRRGSAADGAGQGTRAGDAGEGTGKARTRSAVRKAADNDDNSNGGAGLPSGASHEEDPGVPGASGDGNARKSRKRASRGD